MVHEKIYFCAKSLFKVDCRLFITIASGKTTYMVQYHFIFSIKLKCSTFHQRQYLYYNLIENL